MKQKCRMEEEPLKLPQIARLKSVSDDYSHLGQDYILTHFTTNSSYFYAPMARRFDGMIIIIGVKGTVKITIDLETVDVPPNSVAFVAPDRVFNLIDWVGEELDGYLLFLSSKFTYDLNIDLNAVNTGIFTEAKTVMELDKEKIDVLIRYFYLLHRNASDPNPYDRHIARSLMSAAAYQLMAFSESAQRITAGSRSHSRKLSYVQNFLRLVRSNHKKERSVAYYADRMFISPKYLSLVIKEATGRTAAEWIDQYVLQEAKNLLKYSGKNIQQISYELNFTNQSSFGKYFKHLTGMSPRQFQNV